MDACRHLCRSGTGGGNILLQPVSGFILFVLIRRFKIPSMTVDLTKKGDQSSVAAKHIMLSGVGVRYLLLSEDQRTFKGRVLNLLSSHPAESARFWALQGIDLE